MPTYTLSHSEGLSRGSLAQMRSTGQAHVPLPAEAGVRVTAPARSGAGGLPSARGIGAGDEPAIGLAPDDCRAARRLASEPPGPPTMSTVNDTSSMASLGPNWQR
jgi:hypothetical protein